MVANNTPNGIITIIDTNPENLHAFRGLLLDRGYKVQTIHADGPILDTIKKELPDLVLIPTHTSGMDAYKICKQLKSDAYTASIPVIFTHSQGDENPEKGFSVGGADYISIPAQPEEAFARIKTHLTLHMAQKEIKELSITTEQKAAEHASLREYSNQIEDLVKENPGVFFIWKNADQWPVKFVSENIQAQFGYTAEEFYTQQISYAEIIHPDDLDRVANEVINHTKLGSTIFSQEYRILTKSGKVRWVTDHTKAQRDEEGNVHHYQGIILDITKRKQAEAEKEAAQNILQTTIDGIADPIMYIGMDYKVKLSNQAAREYIPPAKQAENLLCHQISHNRGTPCDGIDHPCPLNLVRESGEETQVTHTHFLSDGTKRVLEIKASPVFDAGNQVTGFVESTRDVTERQKFVEILRQSEEKYRTLIDYMPLGVMLVDAGGNIIEANPTFREMFDSPYIKSDQQVNAFTCPIFSKHDISAGIKSCLETGEGLQGEGQFSNSQGKESTIRYHISPVHDEPGPTKNVQVVMEDITERAMAEEEIRKLTRAVEQSASTIVVTDLDGAIEFVNPAFTRITGYSPEEALGQNPRILKSGEISDEVYTTLWDTITRGDVWKGELLNKKKSGDFYWEFATIAPVKDKNEAITHYVAIKDDISARKEVELALQENEEKFRSLVDQSADGIILMDHNGVIIEWNQGQERISGLKREDMIGTYVWESQLQLIRDDRRTPELEKRIKDGIHKFLAEIPEFTTPIKDERVFQKPDKELRHIQSVTFPININGIKIVGIITRDITEKIQIENELRERTLQLEALREKGLEITAQLDLDSVLRSIVERSIDLLKGEGGGIYLFKPELDILEWTFGTNCSIPPKSVLERGQGMAGKVLEQKEILIVEDYTTWEGRSESYTDHNISSAIQAPIFFGEEFFGILSIHRKTDLSVFNLEDAELLKLFAAQAASAIRNARLFEAEKIARQEAETLQAAAQSLSTELDLDRVLEQIFSELRKVVPFDSLSVQLLEGETLKIIAGKGFSNLEEIIGLSFDISNVQVPNSEVIETIQPLILSEPSQSFKDFGTSPVEKDIRKINSWLGVPLKYRNKCIGMIAFDHHEPGFYNADHAQLALSFATQAAIAIENARIFKELLEAQVEAERSRIIAENSNKAKSIFLANMSHELRTPLNAILGFTQLIGRDSDLDHVQKANLEIIRMSGSHLLEMINAVLEISKIEAGFVELKENDFNLLGLMNNIEAMFSLQARKKNLSLSLQASPDLPEYIKADEGKLRQVLINLINNSVKFTHRGGITLRVKNVEPSKVEQGEPARGRLRFEIEDTGVGISPEEIENIFKPFSQIINGNQSEEGTGLGLTISKEYVGLMGGLIDVTSSVGEGTVFGFDIAYSPGAKEKAPDISRSSKIIGLAPDQPVVRIMVVDDNAISRSLFVQALKFPGLAVYPVKNGMEAISTFEIWKPDLIFMDIRMPVLDGYEAVRQIKAKEDGKDTPIIAVTAGTYEFQEEKLINIGCSDYILKPISIEKIFETLERHIDIEFIYSEIEDSADSEIHDEIQLSERSSELPIELQIALYQAAISADRQRTKVLLDQVQSIDATLAKVLDTWLSEFRFDKIIQVLEKENKDI